MLIKMNSHDKQMIDRIFQDNDLRKSTFTLENMTLSENIIDYYVSKVNQKNFDMLLSSPCFIFLAASKLEKFKDDGFLVDDVKLLKVFNSLTDFVLHYGNGFFTGQRVVRKLRLQALISILKHLDNKFVIDSETYSLCPSVMVFFKKVPLYKRIMNWLKVLLFSERMIYEKNGELHCTGRIVVKPVMSIYLFWHVYFHIIPNYNISSYLSNVCLHFAAVSLVRFCEICYIHWKRTR